MKKGVAKKKDALPHLTPVLPPIDDAYVQAVKIQTLEERFESGVQSRQFYVVCALSNIC